MFFFSLKNNLEANNVLVFSCCLQSRAGVAKKKNNNKTRAFNELIDECMNERH